MQLNSVLSAILRDYWFIDQAVAEAYYPLVDAIIDGGHKNTSEKPENVLSYISLSQSDEDGYSASLEKPQGGSILKMSLKGPMLKYGGPCSYGTMDYVKWIKDANMNEDIAAILLEVDSPGGQASGVDILRDAIAKSVKPFSVQINGLMASAAAYALVGTPNGIFASSKSDTIGSYGGMLSYEKPSEEDVKAGKKRRITVYAPQSTEKNFEAEQAFKGNHEPLREQLRTLVEIQHEAVREFRKPTSKSWETGRMFFAEKALAENLIDGIQDIDATVNHLKSLIQTNNNSSQMFNKHPKLSALAGIPEADLTETQLTEVNAELDSRQIEAVRLVSASFVADADNAIAEKNLALKAKKDAEAALALKTTEATELQAKVDLYGSQAGATPTVVAKKKETVENPKGDAAFISQTDKELMELQGKTFTVA